MLRFGLRDLFLLTLILGLSLTDLIQILKRSPALRWSEVLLPAGVVAAVACLSHAIACGPHRMLRSLSLAGAIVLSAWLLWPNVKWLYNWDSLGLSYYSIAPSWDGYVHGFASTVLGLFELSALVILGLVALTEIAPNRGRLTSVAVRICQSGVFVAVLALALLYWQMLWLAPLPPGPVSDVNRFDQILRIAEQVRLLNGSSLAISELRETNPTAVAGDELQTLYNELLPLLEASNTLPFGPQNCTEEFFSGTTMERIQTFRVLGRSLQAESKAAAEVSDFQRAAAFSRANFGLGLMLCRGGLEVDDLVGHAVGIVLVLAKKHPALDRHADAAGETFQFLVNGRAIFAKGANWIPAHSFVACRACGEGSPALIRQLAPTRNFCARRQQARIDRGQTRRDGVVICEASAAVQ
jgi:hypothetical protein